MRFRQPHVQRQHAGLGAEPEKREQERDRRPEAAGLGRAQRVERIVAVAAVQHAEAQQDAERADVRDQQVDEARLAVLLVVVFGGDEEIRRQRHRFPRDHEEISIIRDQHARHAGKENVVLQAQQRERGGRGAAKIAAREQRNAERDAAQQQQEKSRQRIDTRVKRQVGQPRRQYRRGCRCVDRPQPGRGKRKRHQRPGGEYDIGDEPWRAQTYEPEHAERDPDHRQRDCRFNRLQRE